MTSVTWNHGADASHTFSLRLSVRKASPGGQVAVAATLSAALRATVLSSSRLSRLATYSGFSRPPMYSPSAYNR